jgi:hypothetical protein
MDHAAAVLPGVGDVDLAERLNRFDGMFAEVLAPGFVRVRGASCGLRPG